MRIRDLSPLLILLSTELWSIDQPLVYAQSYSKDKHSKIIALKCESVNVEPTELQHQLERAIVGSFEVILGNLGFNLVPFSQSKRSEVFLLTKITNRFSNGSRSNGDFIISIDCELRESTTHKFEWKKSFQYTATALVGKSISVYAGSQLILHEKYYSSNFSYLSSLEDQEIMININNSNSYTLTKGEDVRKELAVSVLTEMVAEFRQDLIADLNLPVHSNQDNRDLEYRQIEAAIYKALQQKRWESHAYRRIGSIYGKDLTELDKAVHYYQRALNISVEIKNKYSQEIALYEIGNLYYRVREY